jgi:hypothetical protein
LEEVVTLIELAERCEQAKGQSFTLDALITIAIDPERQTIVGQKPGRFPQDPIYGPITEFIPMAEANGSDAAQYLRAPAYTASVDAALTLVPVFQTEDGPRPADYILEHVNSGLTIGARVGHNDPDRTSWGATDALAICAAALRARAS